MAFTPGLHIIIDKTDCDQLPLTQTETCRALLTALLAELKVTVAGEIWKQYENQGYTANLALSDSHISIHTWPEYGKVFFDVYLSSFKKDNTENCRKIAATLDAFFGGTCHNQTELWR